MNDLRRSENPASTQQPQTIEQILTNLVNCTKHEDDVLQQFKPECITKWQAVAAINALIEQREVEARIAELWNPNLRLVPGNEDWVKKRVAELQSNKGRTK